jgi:hypothetical protein
MESLNNKRARLRTELQQAYDTWMDASEWQACHSTPDASVDVSGSSDAARVQWFAYLTAKERLVLAYAELPLAA